MTGGLALTLVAGAALSSDSGEFTGSRGSFVQAMSSGRGSHPERKPQSVSVKALRRITDRNSLVQAIGDLQQKENGDLQLHYEKPIDPGAPALLTGTSHEACRSWAAEVTDISADGVVSYTEPSWQQRPCSRDVDDLYRQLFFTGRHAFVVYETSVQGEYVLARPGATEGIAFVPFLWFPNR